MATIESKETGGCKNEYKKTPGISAAYFVNRDAANITIIFTTTKGNGVASGISFFVCS
jgi:hypothetical protein